MNNIFIIAAENSAENYGSKIIDTFREKGNKYRFFGAGGDKFSDRGVDILVHNRNLSIVGIIEVVSSIFRLKKYMNKFVKEAKKRRADAAILIDYPDFNLRLAKKFKKAGIPVYYYISPTIWAWRYSRVKLIKKYTDHIFIIFPFEKDIYEKEKISHTYTGHPLMNQIKISMGNKEFREKKNISEDKKVLTLLPGSRISEINSLLPEMLETVKILKKKFNLEVFILKARNIDSRIIKDICKTAGIKIHITEQSEGYNMINGSDAVLTTCGTSNLEIAIIGTPFVAVYRVNRLSYLLGKGFLKINLYSIVNILLKKGVVTELIQKDFTAEKCSKAITELLDDPDRKKNLSKEFRKLKDILSMNMNPSEIIFEKMINDLKTKKI
ncbi:MAG: lipid-A-disaccharide synthase [Acidobacteriota bacterium]